MNYIYIYVEMHIHIYTYKLIFRYKSSLVTQLIFKKKNKF